MSTDNFGSLGADFFIKTYNKGSTMSQADLDALVQYVQLTTTILAIGDFTADEQDSVWMILERTDVNTAPGYTVTNNIDVTMTSGGLVTINSLPWSKITGKPSLFSGDYNDLTNKPTLTTGPQGATGPQGPAGADGAQGEQGLPGADGQGVPAGGTAGQVLAKVDGTDYNTEWVTPTGVSGPTNEITNTSPEGSTYSVSVGTDGVVTMVTSRGNLEFGALPEEGAPQHLHIMRPADQGGSTDLYFGDDYNYFKLPGNYGAGTLGVDIGANDGAGGAQHVWRFGTDGHLTLPAGGDIKDSTGASVLGGGSSANTGDIVFSGDTLRNPEDNTVRLESQSINEIASYNFTPQGGDYSTAVWDGSSITFNDPTQAIYDAIWALTDVSVVEVQVGSTWYTVTYGGSSTPGMPAAATLFVNESAVGGPLNIDNVQITINQGTTSYVEIDGTDFRVDVKDDIRMYAYDVFLLSNKGIGENIQIATNDGDHTWYFKSDGKLQLPSGGDIIDEDGNSVLGGGSSSGWAPGGNIVQNVDTDLRLVVQDPSENNYRLDLAIEDTSGSVKSRLEIDYDRIQIETWAGQNQWRFESSGQFRIPGNINTYDKDIEIIAMNAGTAGNITIKAVSNVDDIHYSQVQLTQSGVTITADMDGTPGGKSFEFRDTGVLALPAGGDIVDSNGASVLGGGGGTTLPADASGYLNNDGSGTLSWVPGNPSGSGLLPYSDVKVLSDTTTADWTEFTLSGTMDSMNDYSSSIATITLTSSTAYGKTITANTKNLWVTNAKVNSNDYLVAEFPPSPAVGDIFSVVPVAVTQTVTAGSFVIGETYTIVTVGSTNFTTIGAAMNGTGQVFVATGAGTGTGTATTSAGAKKLIYKPATGQRARTMYVGNNPPVMFGQGGAYDFVYVDLGGQYANQPATWVYAGLVDGIPTWYHTYF